MTENLDLDFIRRQFPGLDSEWVLCDNAGGSQIVRHAVDRMNEYLLSSNVQHGASYGLSQLASERVKRGLQTAATMINAADLREVVIGPSSSQLINNLAQAMQPLLAPGDEIIVTNVDHEANIGPWRRLDRHQVTIKEWSLNLESERLELDDLAKLMTDRTRLVCFTHTSNILGEIYPIQDYVRFVHERGARVCIDGVAYAPHRAVDVQKFDVDFYVFSVYKVFGPHLALMYAKLPHLRELANINHYFLAEEIPYKLEPGGVNYELTYSLHGIGEYLEDVAFSLNTAEDTGRRERMEHAFDAISQHEYRLADQLLDYLASRPDLRIVGPAAPDADLRVPTISLVSSRQPSDAIVTALDKHFIAARYGDFYARRLIEALGLGPDSGVVRISLAHYNSSEEITRLCQALDQVL